MRAYIGAYAMLLGLLAYLGLSVAGVVPSPAELEGTVSVAFVLGVTTIFGILYAIVIALAASWRDAPRRRWFWLAGTVPALIFFGGDIRKIAGTITQPSWSALFGSLLLISLGTLIVAALLSYRDARLAPR
jgi:hypothetical protein